MSLRNKIKLTMVSGILDLPVYEVYMYIKRVIYVYKTCTFYKNINFHSFTLFHFIKYSLK